MMKLAGGDDDPDGLASWMMPLVAHLPSMLDLTLTLSPTEKQSFEELPFLFAILSCTA